MTQEVLAGRIYSQAPTISAMERGERPITHKTLEVLCDVFAVLPEEFYKIDHNGKDDLDKMLAEERGVAPVLLRTGRFRRQAG